MVQRIAGLACGILPLQTSRQLAAKKWQHLFLVYSAALISALLAWLYIFEPLVKNPIEKQQPM